MGSSLTYVTALWSLIRTRNISSCLFHIFLILTGVSRDGRKFTTTRKHLTISFGARRNRYKTDKIAFFNFKNIHLSSNLRLSNASTRCLLTFCGSSLRNRKLIARMSLLNRWFRIRQIVSRVPCLTERLLMERKESNQTKLADN